MQLPQQLPPKATPIGRPAKSITDLKKHNRKLRRANAALIRKCSTFKAEIKEFKAAEVPSTNCELLKLVKSTGRWKNAEGQITCSAALLLGQLRAIGISSEKMPLALNLFVTLYFGSVESKTMQFSYVANSKSDMRYAIK